MASAKRAIELSEGISRNDSLQEDERKKCRQGVSDLNSRLLYGDRTSETTTSSLVKNDGGRECASLAQRKKEFKTYLWGKNCFCVHSLSPHMTMSGNEAAPKV